MNFQTRRLQDWGWENSSARLPTIPIGGLDKVRSLCGLRRRPLPRIRKSNLARSQPLNPISSTTRTRRAQNWTATYTATLLSSLTASGSNNFTWIVGDIAYADDSYGHVGELLNFGYEQVYNGFMDKSWLGGIASSVPIQVSVGNHESEVRVQAEERVLANSASLALTTTYIRHFALRLSRPSSTRRTTLRMPFFISRRSACMCVDALTP